MQIMHPSDEHSERQLVPSVAPYSTPYQPT